MPRRSAAFSSLSNVSDQPPSSGPFAQSLFRLPARTASATSVRHSPLRPWMNRALPELPEFAWDQPNFFARACLGAVERLIANGQSSQDTRVTRHLARHTDRSVDRSGRERLIGIADPPDAAHRAASPRRFASARPPERAEIIVLVLRPRSPRRRPRARDRIARGTRRPAPRHVALPTALQLAQHLPRTRHVASHVAANAQRHRLRRRELEVREETRHRMQAIQRHARFLRKLLERLPLQYPN